LNFEPPLGFDRTACPERREAKSMESDGTVGTSETIGTIGTIYFYGGHVINGAIEFDS